MLRDLTANLGLKITALLLAVLIWFYVSLNQGPEVVREFTSIKLTARNVSENVVITNELPSIRVTLRGSKVLMDKIEKENIIAYIDLLDKKPSKDQVYVKIDAPQTVTVISTDPELVPVDLQNLAAKEVPIYINYSGQAPAGIALDVPTINPSRLPITGPEQNIAKIKEARVTVNRADAKEGQFSLNLPYDLIDESGQAISKTKLSSLKIRSSYETLTVDFEGISRQQVKTVGIRARTTGNLPSDRVINSIDVLPKSVMISGSYEVLSKIDAIYTLAFNLNGVAASIDQMIDLDVPKGVSADVSYARIIVNIEPIGTKNIRAYVDVVSGGKDYEINPSIVIIKIQGPSSLLSSLTLVLVSIDISSLPKGEHTLQVMVKGLPDGVTVVQTPTVRVKIP